VWLVTNVERLGGMLPGKRGPQLTGRTVRPAGMGIQSRYRFLQLPLLLTALAAVQLIPPDSCLGQEATLAPGDRIRVKPLVRPKDRVTASFISVVEDTLAFETQGDLRRLALPDIQTLQVSTGKQSHLVGTIAGGFTGALVGMIVGMGIDEALDDYCIEYCGLRGAFYGFLVGAVGGVFAGYHLLAKEEWADVNIEGLRVGLGPGSVRIYVGR